MKNIYIRTVDWGGLYIKQLIFFKWVISYCNNKAWFNGEKGRTLDIKPRKETTL